VTGGDDVRDFKVIDGLPVCQTPRAFEACCDDCAGVGTDGDGTHLCMGEVRDDRARLVEIARVVYGPDYSEPYDSERSLAGLAQAVTAGWAEKERLRGVAELYKRSDDLVIACHCDGGCGCGGGAR